MTYKHFTYFKIDFIIKARKIKLNYSKEEFYYEKNFMLITYYVNDF